MALSLNKPIMETICLQNVRGQKRIFHMDNMNAHDARKSKACIDDNSGTYVVIETDLNLIISKQNFLELFS